MDGKEDGELLHAQKNNISFTRTILCGIFKDPFVGTENNKKKNQVAAGFRCRGSVGSVAQHTNRLFVVLKIQSTHENVRGLL